MYLVVILKFVSTRVQTFAYPFTHIPYLDTGLFWQADMPRRTGGIMVLA